MYFWLRLIGYFLTTWRRKPLDVPFGTSCLHYRAWPTDIDASMHMNNARYSVLADIGRFDLIFRMGIAKVVMREKYIPVLLFASTRYRREIRNFETFKVETRILSWDNTNLFIEHKFTLTSGKYKGQVSALMVVKAGLYNRKEKAFIEYDKLIDRMGIDAKSPALPEAVKTLLAADKAFQDATKDNQIDQQKLSA
ncbi:MAG: thioesterase family protein [Methyloligellaceae bacterium]